MTGLYHHPPIWLHRISARWKLCALAGASIALAILTDPLILAGAFFAALSVYVISGISRRLRMLASLTFVFAIVFAAQYWTMGFIDAVRIVLRMGCMILLADLVTLSTRTQDMMDTLTTVLAPLRFSGLRQDTIAFAVAFTIRLVPLLLSLWSQQSEAYRARTGRRASWRLLAPFLAQLLRTADHMAEALDARGFGTGPAPCETKS